MNSAFSVALVDASETTFEESHVREDLVVFDMQFQHDEGDFASLTLEVQNPRVGLIAPGRPLWIWFAWNPNYVPDEHGASSEGEAAFSDMVPLFFGRIMGVPEDITEDTVRLTFLARPADFEEQKTALASSLRVFPYFDPVWFSPESRFENDNVLESRSALWHIDPVTHVVTISDIVTGEDGVITVGEGDAFHDSVRISYGEPPCRQLNVTASVNWDQKGIGAVPIPLRPSLDTYTGAGLIENWPKAGDTIGGGWSVADGVAVRVDGNGTDSWTWTNMIPPAAPFSDDEKIIFVPSWAKPWVFYKQEFPGKQLRVKRWTVHGSLSVKFDVSRGKSETVAFVLRSDTQSILTDSADGEAQDLHFSSSEVATPVGVFSDGSFDIPIGKPSARSYLTTDRGQQSLEYLILVARARLVASARCVDLACEVPWEFAISQAVSLRKSAVLTDERLPGGIAGGKIKSISLSANGEGVFNAAMVMGCTIGRGGTIEATAGTPTYVETGYVTKPYQVHDNEFVMPVAGEVAYQSILGLPPNDDGFDLERMVGARIIKAGPTYTNLAEEQRDFIQPAESPGDVYTLLNTKQTTIAFELYPLNSGPFDTTYSLETTLLKIPKTIDLEADAESS